MNRNTFGSKFGALMALIGAAVGLGNIWKFPYLAGQNGGGAFVLLYLFCVIFIGIPLMITAFALGRNGGRNVFGSYKKFIPNSKLHYFGIISVVCSLFILSFYAMVAGWSIGYLKFFTTNSFSGLNLSQIADFYEGFVSDPIKPVLLQILFICFTGMIVVFGVRRGIERSSKVLIPLFFIILIVLCIKSCILNDTKYAWFFMFYPDFSQLDSKSLLDALGQSFFSLSVGAGIMLTYGSYLNKDRDLVKIGLNVGFFDTLFALIAGVTIFPIAFNYGVSPKIGVGLLFQTLPRMLNQIPFGSFLGVLFFLLILFAALTSAISLMEVIVVFLVEECNYKRIKATFLTILFVSIFGSLSAMSFGLFSEYTILGNTFFDLMDYISVNVFLPISGLFLCGLAGWIIDEDVIKKELTNDGKMNFRFFSLYIFLIRYVIPPTIFLILLDGLGVFI